MFVSLRAHQPELSEVMPSRRKNHWIHGANPLFIKTNRCLTAEVAVHLYFPGPFLDSNMWLPNRQAGLLNHCSSQTFGKVNCDDSAYEFIFCIVLVILKYSLYNDIKYDYFMHTKAHKLPVSDCNYLTLYKHFQTDTFCTERVKILSRLKFKLWVTNHSQKLKLLSPFIACVLAKSIR